MNYINLHGSIMIIEFLIGKTRTKIGGYQNLIKTHVKYELSFLSKSKINEYMIYKDSFWSYILNQPEIKQALDARKIVSMDDLLFQTQLYYENLGEFFNPDKFS